MLGLQLHRYMSESITQIMTQQKTSETFDSNKQKDLNHKQTDEKILDQQLQTDIYRDTVSQIRAAHSGGSQCFPGKVNFMSIFLVSLHQSHKSINSLNFLVLQYTNWQTAGFCVKIAKNSSLARPCQTFSVNSGMTIESDKILFQFRLIPTPRTPQYLLTFC